MKEIDIDAIKQVAPSNKTIAFVMHECGATYQQIADYLGVTRQAAHYVIKTMKNES